MEMDEGLIDTSFGNHVAGHITVDRAIKRPLQTESGRAANAEATNIEQWVYTAGIQTERAVASAICVWMPAV